MTLAVRVGTAPSTHHRPAVPYVKRSFAAAQDDSPTDTVHSNVSQRHECEEARMAEGAHDESVAIESVLTEDERINPPPHVLLQATVQDPDGVYERSIA